MLVKQLADIMKISMMHYFFNTKRLGHSIPLVLHPYLMQIVRNRKIGIEVNPISHWILGYVFDPRWHPARQMIASNIGVTISSDTFTAIII